MSKLVNIALNSLIKEAAAPGFVNTMKSMTNGMAQRGKATLKGLNNVGQAAASFMQGTVDAAGGVGGGAWNRNGGLGRINTMRNIYSGPNKKVNGIAYNLGNMLGSPVTSGGIGNMGGFKGNI